MGATDAQLGEHKESSENLTICSAAEWLPGCQKLPPFPDYPSSWGYSLFPLEEDPQQEGWCSMGFLSADPGHLVDEVVIMNDCLQPQPGRLLSVSSLDLAHGCMAGMDRSRIP